MQLSVQFLDAFRTHLPETTILLRLLLASVLGAVIGWDRELRDHAAGLRTHMLVSLAAAMFTVIAFELVYEFRAMSDAIRSDPVRVIEAVTAGVAFLAAGSIIFSGGRVHGLTTGAGMWLAGAVGVAAGAGYYLLAAMAAALALAVLELVALLERRRRGAPRGDGHAREGSGGHGQPRR